MKAGHFAQVNNRRTPMNDTQANQPVTASLVASNRRLTFLPTYFGPRLMMRGESLVYAWLRRLSEDYNGGFWNYYELSNGGFYLAPELTGRLCLEVDGNGYSGELSADAAGIVATLFTLGQLAADNQGTDVADALIDRYHFLRDFARDQAEAAEIFRAID
nr:antirestriction protein KlcA [uncultured bacterium]